MKTDSNSFAEQLDAAAGNKDLDALVKLVNEVGDQEDSNRSFVVAEANIVDLESLCDLVKPVEHKPIE